MGRWCCVSFQCQGVLLIWSRVGQGPTALAVGAGGCCLDIFSLVYHFSFLSPSLWETARYRLKYCLKGPLSPKQSTNQLKHKLSGTKAYEQTSEKEKSVINNHIFHNATRFAVSVNEDQEGLPTFYWLPKLHKKPYKARFIANSSSCTTTELSKLLISCLTTIKNHVIKYCEKVYERSGKNLFRSIKNSCEVLNKLKSRGFRASSLSTYDFSTLYTTLPHNLIKDKPVDLIEIEFSVK